MTALSAAPSQPGPSRAGSRRAESGRRYEIGLLLLLAVVPLFLTPRIDGQGVLIAVIGAAPVLLNCVGMMLVHRVDGFLNLAQVQVGLVAAALFDSLNRGRFLTRGVATICPDCVGDDPGQALLGLNFALSATVALVGAAVLSWALQATVMRRMEGAPRLMATVITVFIAQALAAATPQVRSFLAEKDADGKLASLPSGYVIGGGTLDLGDLRIPVWSLAFIVLTVLALAAVSVGLRRGGWGVRLRSVAANRDRAQTLGIDAVSVSGRVWAVAGLLSGLAGVLPAIAASSDALALPRDGDPAVTGSGVQIPVLVLMLTVLVFARFEHLWVAALAAVVLGVLGQALQSATGSPTLMQASYLLLLAAVLGARRDTLSRVERDDTSADAMTREVRGIPRELRGLESIRGYVRMGLIVGSVALLGAPALLDSGAVSLLVEAMIFALVGLSVYVLTGWAGYVSFGQFGVAAVGGWIAAVSGIPFVPALLVAVVAGALVSVLIGLPAIRLRGMYLAICTLAFALTAQSVLLDATLLGRFVPESVPRADLLGISLADERAFYYVAVLLTVGACLVVAGLRRARFGRVLIALRSNEAAARSFGVSPVRARLGAFALAGALASAGGALAVFHSGHLAPQQFAASMSFTVYLNTLVGGLGSIAGPLLGAAFYALVTLFFSGNALATYAATGTGAVLLLLAVPGGLVEMFAAARDGALLRLAFRLHIPVPRLMGDGGIAAAQGRALLDEKRASLRRPGTKPLLSYVPESERDASASDPVSGRAPTPGATNPERETAS